MLLGVSASLLGTADPFISKTLCLHLPALLPSRHSDIEIPSIVQTAAITGLGLLHCRSGHRLMTEFLLAELCRMPSSDRMDTREALALSAGWSLGMVLLGLKTAKKLENDVILTQNWDNNRLEDRLENLINGGRRPDPSTLFPVSS